MRNYFTPIKMIVKKYFSLVVFVFILIVSGAFAYKLCTSEDADDRYVKGSGIVPPKCYVEMMKDYPVKVPATKYWYRFDYVTKREQVVELGSLFYPAEELDAAIMKIYGIHVMDVVGVMVFSYNDDWKLLFDISLNDDNRIIFHKKPPPPIKDQLVM